MLLGPETEPPTFQGSGREQSWDETAGPVAASNDPEQLVQDPWPTDAISEEEDEVAERDRIHDQPEHEDREGWTFHEDLPEEILYSDNPVFDAIDDDVHPVTGDPLGGESFTSNAPMEVSAEIHGDSWWWHQVLLFKNTSDVPYHLDGAVIWWVGPSAYGETMSAGHYNNEQRPGPGHGHPQRDFIEVVYDEEQELSVFIIRLAFHDSPYNMRTAYPNQHWSLEVSVGDALDQRYETAEERQAVLETMVETAHVELETDMDRNDDLLDELNLRNRVAN